MDINNQDNWEGLKMKGSKEQTYGVLTPNPRERDFTPPGKQHS